MGTKKVGAISRDTVGPNRKRRIIHPGSFGCPCSAAFFWAALHAWNRYETFLKPVTSISYPACANLPLTLHMEVTTNFANLWQQCSIRFWAHANDVCSVPKPAAVTCQPFVQGFIQIMRSCCHSECKFPAIS